MAKWATRPYPTPTYNLVVEVLRHGPATTAEIADELGITQHAVRSAILTRRENATLPVSTSPWTHVAEWRRGAPRAKPPAVWALGKKADAPYPAPASGSERNARHRAKQKTPALVTQRVAVSVFDLGRKMADA